MYPLHGMCQKLSKKSTLEIFHNLFVPQKGIVKNMNKRIPMATALRTRCAERTRTMQLAACVHLLNTCTVLFSGICVRAEWRCKYE